MAKKRERKRVVVNFTKPSRTQKQFRDECDINNIIKRFQTTGQLPSMIKNNPQYGNFAEVTDYQTSLNLVIKAQEQFSALNARLRNRFNNDPAQFLAFVGDKANLQEMVKLGLATIPKEDKLPSEASSASSAEASAQGEKS